MLIRRHKFLVPETLVTNDPDAVREFLAEHGRVIYKSISGLRSIVTEIGDADLERLEELRACPVQFQEYVPGFDVRVHVVGDEVIATRIDSHGNRLSICGSWGSRHGARTFRHPKRPRRPMPSSVQGLGLAFSGIDLRITPNGEVYCFEVNPSPAFSYYESHTGQPISLALARYLAGYG